ncbi:neutral zinc metallopeptidase family protein [Mycolicibacterium hassiacum DSM 44199]|jgi:predicted metalloprotease|uniref:Neutral zinc metallopeptidase family protein n=1 Tax=Mycolicibacterium hassiacum (strain DSM 44199 / CIP 105218 / JCM 12690 / 3849) TaxID=1122247 RepID=K5BCB5_MYCHD|nr:neutral zinc metallopeptidase [Mycolicibacterium hassiacum]EKF25075.1 neutral zinc metallopeptidase family protein [Mycolicibacterium hassiacum DSM 44199]MBX5488957.1 neutral zinc metallopeptidase [Mycolicibacterium hassiacum]MDA4087980.1 peptidase [Mycolicibacterium hassiacum DSM 44199]PZN19337.1 MAG: peptidase [Mycolicibacterium hassiacum]VCT88351.1 hypothetical protein MHAS_00031 [Mycolicibacterium hassiacum DSM 44199]
MTRWGAAARSLIAAASTIALVGGCGPASSTVVEGRAASMLFNPERVGGLPVSDGPSGIRPDAPAPVTQPENGDGSEMDRLAALAVDDIEEFWEENYSRYLPGRFEPVKRVVSYDSTVRRGPRICGSDLYELANAFYCLLDDVIAWDRGLLVPVAVEHFGEMGVVGVLAHEYGHALQFKSGLVDKSTKVLVREQQADCFAGVYLHWVAAGNSKRFTLSTGDGLNRVLGGVIYLRDPLMVGGALADAHGSALDRISAFQMGFAGGADQCAAIDMEEIEKRQGDLPQQLGWDAIFDEPVLDSPIDESTLSQLMDVLDDIYRPQEPPTLSTSPGSCTRADPDAPAVYCPDTNTIHVDMASLQMLGEPKNEDKDRVLVQGDNTALSIVISRYALAVQREHGAKLDDAVAALRTACLTGVAQGRMTDENGIDFVLSPGDADEAVAGLLTNGLVASDVNNVPAPAGFTRILAYRLGLSSEVDECFQRFT